MTRTIDLYHRTTPEAARAIRSAGQWVSKEWTNEVYFSDVQNGMASGYGTAVIHVRIPLTMAHLDDEFPDGERHFRVKASTLSKRALVGVYGASFAFERTSPDAGRLVHENGVYVGDAVRDVDGSWGWWPDRERSGSLDAHALHELAYVLEGLE